MKAKIAQALERTYDPDPKVRRAGLLQLCPCHVRADFPAIWDRLFELRRDHDAGVRSLVLHSLCDGSPRAREAEVLEAVEGIARDPDPKLRRRARRALAVYRRTGRINQE